MSDVTGLRASLQRIESMLGDQPRWPQLRTAHLDLVTVTGQLQGALSEQRRLGGDAGTLQHAEESLDAMKATVRQVGMDIRLASEGALLLGLQTCLRLAFEVLDLLDSPD